MPRAPARACASFHKVPEITVIIELKWGDWKYVKTMNFQFFNGAQAGKSKPNPKLKPKPKLKTKLKPKMKLNKLESKLKHLKNN